MRKAFLVCAALFLALSGLRAQVITDLFEARSALSRDYRNIAAKYQALELKSEALQSLRSAAPGELRMRLPYEGELIELEMEKVKITSDNFRVTEAGANGVIREITVDPGLYYRGRIKGKPGSIASISVLNDQVMGIMADENGNLVLGTIEKEGKASSEYSLYRDRELKVKNPLSCFVEDESLVVGDNTGISMQNSPQPRGNTVGEPVDIYFECDFKMYQDRGSNTVNTINYVLGFFNNVAQIYDNEDIHVQVSHIQVWTQQDPEATAGHNTTSAVLQSFANRMSFTSYSGDYAHFLSTRSLGGGIAYVLGSPCNSQKQFRTAVSAVHNSYNNFPTYSWTVQVVTHELGHNFGSRHTQWCGWVGGALDNCYQTEPASSGSGNCPPGPTPVNGGTIMSYCHLSGFGINFSNGFGAQPGDKIREVIGAATCFGNCRMTVSFSKLDASCNQNNGTATVTAANGTGNLTYAWSNGQTGQTLVNAAPGTYHVTVTDGTGCKVTDDVVIGNSGTTLTFAISPDNVAAICPGGNITISATNNPAYSYQWFNGANPIGGATSSSLNITAPGNYSVTATSGACSGSRPIQIIEVANPTATITPSGSTTICEGSLLTLDADAGAGFAYQWYRNNNIINGATASSYSATQSGSYTVKVSAGATCESTSQPVVVTVNPSPVVNLSNVGSLSFCEGNSVVFNTTTGTGYIYQWYVDGDAIQGATGSSYTASSTGVYSVTTTLGSCPVTSELKSVTVLPRPTVTVTPELSTIEKFQTQTLTGAGALNYNWSSLPDMVSSTATSGTYRPLSTTQYTLEGIAANGCRNTATATIEVIGCGPVTNFNSQPFSPSRVLLTWTNPEGASSDSVQYRIVGSSNWEKIFVQGNSVELTGLQPGANYEYNIIPLCTTTNTFLASANQSFQTQALTNGRFIRLFPNPVSNSARLEVISANSFDLQIAIYDNTGKMIRQYQGGQNRPAGQFIQNIDASGLANGVYLINVMMGAEKEVIKMVVAR